MRRFATILGLSALGAAALVLPSTTVSSAAGGVGDGPADSAPAGLQRAVVSPTVHSVRLITGQTVLLRSGADGTTHPCLADHAPFVWTRGPNGLVVLPRAASTRVRGLDLSLFNATALAAATHHGRTPIVVRLKPGAGRPDLAGLRIMPGASRTPSGATVLHASYGQHFPGLGAPALRGVASIRLDAPATPTVDRATTGPKHTVTVQVTTKDGSAPDFAIVDLQSTVDGDVFDQEQTDADGLATFTKVPEGQFSVIVGSDAAILVNSQFDVTADTSLAMDLGDATVKPHVTLVGRHVLTTSTSVEREPEQGFPIGWGSDGNDHFDLRLQPTSGKVDHGGLHTLVTTTLVKGRTHGGYDRIALTADAARGVPSDLTYVHHRRDFARTTDLLYGNGPTAVHPLWLIPESSYASDAMTDATVPVSIPSRLHLWMQAGHGIGLQQTLYPLASMSQGDDTAIMDLRAYRKPGRLAPRSFLHGPVGPGDELSPHSPYSSGLARNRTQLQIWLSLFAAAGVPHDIRHIFELDFSDPKVATWSLNLGRHTLAHGHGFSFRGRLVTVPAGPRTYQLVATSHPGATWDLSTHVTDVWTFHSRAGHRDVPLVTPSYLPPTDVAGNIGPGRTGFRLAFHSTAHSAPITHATVELSTNDGRTWRPLRVHRTSGLTFHVGYRNPAARGDRRYVSLRVTARDAHGNSVQETALHAYRLP